jgi:AcrR family transcriptional regulator
MDLENSQKKTIKKRRTNKEIDNLLSHTVTKLIIKKGFNNLTLTGIAKEAKINPWVIYNRYDNLDDLLDKYIRKYDYWINDLIVISLEKTPKENFKCIVTNFITELYNNEVMQKILLWELNDTHSKITRRIADNRETDSDNLLKYFNNIFDNKDINFNMFLSLMIASIYYLVLHKKISTFNTIDFTKKQSKDDLIKTIEKIIDIVMPDY